MNLTLTMNDINKLPLYVKELSNNTSIDSHLFYYDTVTSTMDIGRELVKESKAKHGDIVLAENQDGGRGRRGRKWSSPSGGLWFTVIIRPNLEPGKNPLIALLSAVAVVEAVKSNSDITPSIKWPNDVLINNKKLCGIALDLVFDQKFKPWILLGIGLNVNIDINKLPLEIKEIATSIYNETGKIQNRAHILISIISNLLKYLNELKTNEQQALDRWRIYDITLNSELNVYPAGGKEPYIGQAIDIDDCGALVIKDHNNELKTVFAADVSVRIRNK